MARQLQPAPQRHSPPAKKVEELDGQGVAWLQLPWRVGGGGATAAATGLALLLSVGWRSMTLPQLNAATVITETHDTGRLIQRFEQPWSEPRMALEDYDFLLERVREEHGWGQQHAEGAISEYLRFLHMLAAAPRMELVASSDIDLVWHEHLMDTENYLKDSTRLFGRFLHHRRARTAEEFADIPESYRRTKHAYARHFGVAPPSRFWGATTTAASMCGGGGANSGPSFANGTSSSSSSGESTATSGSHRHQVPVVLLFLSVVGVALSLAPCK